MTLHNDFWKGYKGHNGSITGPIVVFVPGRAEIKILIDMIKNAQRRGFTAGLLPYGFLADAPPFLSERFASKARRILNATRSLTDRFDPKLPGLAKVDCRVNPEQYPLRRVIIATNAAETAVTFEDCWAVVDTCLLNQMTYDPMLPGLGVRMVTQTEWNSMPETEPPQPELEDMTPIYLRLLRHANPEVRNQILDELNIPEQLRMAIERCI